MGCFDITVHKKGHLKEKYLVGTCYMVLPMIQDYAEWVMPDPPMQDCARNKLKG